MGFLFFFFVGFFFLPAAPGLYFQVSAFCRSQQSIPLQEREELALQQVPLEALQNTVTMDTNLTGRRVSGVFVCLTLYAIAKKTRRRGGEDVRERAGVCRCSLHVFQCKYKIVTPSCHEVWWLVSA